MPFPIPFQVTCPGPHGQGFDVMFNRYDQAGSNKRSLKIYEKIYNYSRFPMAKPVPCKNGVWHPFVGAWELPKRNSKQPRMVQVV